MQLDSIGNLFRFFEKEDAPEDILNKEELVKLARIDELIRTLAAIIEA
jgi:hypothetical protein